MTAAAMTTLAKLYVAGTPQTQAADPRQVANNAGGHVFALDDWKRLERFLILGSEAPTYYQSAQKLTRENAGCVARCYSADPLRTVATIVAVSESGRAPRVAPAIFALAIGTLSPDVAARQAAYGAIGRVCRTASHLFELTATTQALGKGWGRGLKRAVARWYEGMDVGKLALQAVKYRTRNDMTHARALRLTHPTAKGDASRAALYRWMLGDGDLAQELPWIVRGHVDAMTADARTLPGIAKAYGLPWEALPTQALTDPAVWRALLPSMGLTALLRNLGRLTRLGVIAPLADETAAVCARLTDGQALKAARVHPFAVLLALTAYKAGQPIAAARRGVGAEAGWQADAEVLAALEKAFRLSFHNVEPTGKRHLIALDVSGSMADSMLMNSHLSAREASVAMAMATIAVEPRTHVVGFSSESRASELVPLDLSNASLPQAIKRVSGLPFCGTDCSLPMTYALERKIPVDAFVVYTDNETYAGRQHPHEALARYRRAMRIDAKLIVVGMTSTGFTIADPTDAGMLDVVGFDAAAPAVMADFLRA